jgi:hypothetical protein
VARGGGARSILTVSLMGIGTTELNGKDFDGSTAAVGGKAHLMQEMG